MTDAVTNPPVGIADETEIQLALELIRTFPSDLSRASFLGSVLPKLLPMIGPEGGLVSQHSGSWIREVWIGEPRPLPELLISEAIDQGSIRTSDGWCVAPLAVAGASGDSSLPPPAAAALVLRWSEGDQAEAGLARPRTETVSAAAQLLAGALHRVETNDRQLRRIQQLSAVLQAAAEWQNLDDDDALLRRIADTATELLNCERASIFLWDRRRKKLIGRPALGIKGNRLEVDDNAGVVGEVLRTAEAKIWNGDSDDERRVNRTVDRSLDFETRSLVAVPLGGRRDRVDRGL